MLYNRKVKQKPSAHRTCSQPYALSNLVVNFLLFKKFFTIACAKSCVVDLTLLKPVFHWVVYSARSGKPIVFHRIKFNFSAAENSANQSYCSFCVPRDQNNREQLLYGWFRLVENRLCLTSLIKHLQRASFIAIHGFHIQPPGSKRVITQKFSRDFIPLIIIL